MKVKAALPKGTSDGLSELESKVIKKSTPIVAVVILEEHSRTQDHDTKEWEVTLRMRRIEPLLADDVEAATRLLQRSFESRTGDATLPIELEEDIRDALKGVDHFIPETQHVVPEGAPEGGYASLTIPKLTALLRDRKLDASKGTKTELIGRLEWDDANPIQQASNVTSLFSDGSTPVESVEAEEPPHADAIESIEPDAGVDIDEVDPDDVYVPGDEDAPDEEPEPEEQ